VMFFVSGEFLGLASVKACAEVLSNFRNAGLVKQLFEHNYRPKEDNFKN
jgi:hypothetical protein